MANAPSMEKGRKGLSPETLGGRGAGQQAPGRWRGRLGQEGGRPPPGARKMAPGGLAEGSLPGLQD